MALGMLDLSIVTDRLIEQLDACTSKSELWRASRFDITYTGLAPDEARLSDGCQVSVYLFHVAVDKFYRNTYPTGGSAQAIPEQPLALTLYYLVTAYSEKNWVQEQQAMSIALKCLHEHPIVRAKVPIDAIRTREEEFTLTIEPQTADDIGRLWQAITRPMRLSAVYRASVVFLEPPPPRTPDVVRHAPVFEPPYEIQPFRVLPEPGVVSASTDETGFVAITIAKAGFATGVTTIRLRALPLVEPKNATDPLVGGQFRVAAQEILHLRVPLHTPKGQYLLTVQPAGDRRTLEIDLIVPEPIVTVRPDTAGLVTFAIDDARFVEGAVTVMYDGVTLVENTTTGPIAAGEFRVLDLDTLELRAPAGTTEGRYRLEVLPAAGKPTLEIWVDVP